MLRKQEAFDEERFWSNALAVVPKAHMGED
jgi:hypothetical protein